MSMSHETDKLYILDSFALLAFLGGEAGMERVQEVLQAAKRRQAHAHMPSICLGEVLYITERERGLSVAQKTLAAIEQMPIDILDATRPRVLAAAHIKANFRVSYADAFAVAAAQEIGATVLTGDPEFAAVESATVIHVEWLPR